MNLPHPSNAIRNRELEALSLTAEICVGFGITDPSDVYRIHDAVCRVVSRLEQDPARERVLAMLGGD